MSLLSQEQALKLVRRLANDPVFHRRFPKETIKCLEELGLPTAFAACCENITLPTAAVLAATEKTLASNLTGETVQQIIGLNAG